MITVLLFIQIASFSLGLASLITAVIHYLKYRSRTIMYYVIFLLFFSIRVFLSSVLFSFQLDQSLYYISVLTVYHIIKDITLLFMFFIPAMLLHLLSFRYETSGKIAVFLMALVSAAAMSFPYIFSGSLTGGAVLFTIAERVTPAALFFIGLAMPVLVICNWKSVQKNSIVSGMTLAIFVFFYGFLLFDRITGSSQTGFLTVNNTGKILFQLAGYFILNLFFLIITIRFFIRFQDSSPISEPDTAFFAKYNISEREKEIMYLILSGLNTNDIGEKLFISQKTVKNHIHHIYSKTGVSSRLELAFLIRNEAK